MSVIKSKREESVVEFVNTARELNIYSIRQCTKFPKRYTFFISQKIVDLADFIYESVVKANAINPRNQHEAQIRRDYIMIAYASCESLVAKIAVAQEMFGVEERIMVEWMRLIGYEQRLLAGVKKRDAEKYKKLPDVSCPPISVSELT